MTHNFQYQYKMWMIGLKRFWLRLSGSRQAGLWKGGMIGRVRYFWRWCGKLLIKGRWLIWQTSSRQVPLQSLPMQTLKELYKTILRVLISSSIFAILLRLWIFSQIDGRKAKKEKSNVYMTSTGNLISLGKFNESSAIKLPEGNLVLQSGKGGHSPEGNLTMGTKVKLPEGQSTLCVVDFVK